MSKGVVLVAHNNNTVNYYEMAEFTAKRVHDFLNLPTTLITDSKSITAKSDIFEKIILTNVDSSNYRNKDTWNNKGRYKVFNLSPYDETLVLDVDYLINSDKLNQLFEFKNDFMCHNNTFWLMSSENEQEKLSKNSVNTLWATVIKFKKTTRTEQIFNMLEMVQDNYKHYSNIYGFIPQPYRNDYALTIALKTVNGHLENKEDYIPWPLVHLNEKLKAERLSETSYNIHKIEKDKKQYIQISNKDFHVINKTQFIRLMV